MEQVLQARHSVRAYTAQAIAADKAHAILHAANRAPSAGNLQAYEISVVTSRAGHLQHVSRRLEIGGSMR